MPGPYAIATERLKKILSTYKNTTELKINKNTVLNNKILEAKIQKLKKERNKTINITPLEYPSSFGRSIAFRNQKGIALNK